jgi:hypothetical protein
LTVPIVTQVITKVKSFERLFSNYFLRGGARVTEEREREIEDILEQARLCVKVGDATDLEVAMLDGGRELLAALKEAQDNPTRVCPGCGRTIGLVIGDHTYKGGMPLCHEAHVRASLLEEAERRAEVAEAALKEARETNTSFHRRLQAVEAKYETPVGKMAHRIETLVSTLKHLQSAYDMLSRSYCWGNRYVMDAHQQEAQAREVGYQEGIEAAMGAFRAKASLNSNWSVSTHSLIREYSKEVESQLLPAPETPAGVGEIGETCNETDGNRPFVRVVEEKGEVNL